MTAALFGVYGASGCGRGIMPLARQQLVRQGRAADRLVFIDDNANAAEINGHSIVPFEKFLDMSQGVSSSVGLATANSQVRAKLYDRCLENGIGIWDIRAEDVVVMDNVEIGPGALLSPFVTMTSNIKIGICFHANLYSYVEHDCVIGDFVTFAPAVKCNGNVHIEDHAYIGTGAILRQGKPGAPLVIGRGAIVGMGAVVTKDVPAGTTVVGIPARPLTRA